MPERHKSPNGFYDMDRPSTAIFYVSGKLEKDLGFETDSYEDLLDPKLSGKTLLTDPTSSSPA